MRARGSAAPLTRRPGRADARRAGERARVAQQALVLPQHRARRRVGPLLEQGPGRGGVGRARLRALQPHRPAALGRVRVRGLRAARAAWG